MKAKDVSNSSLAVVFCFGILAIIPLAIGFAIHPILGVILLIGSLFAGYKLFVGCMNSLTKDAAELELHKRREYVRRRQSVAKLEMDLFDDPLDAVNEEGKPKLHLNTCKCKMCRSS